MPVWRLLNVTADQSRGGDQNLPLDRGDTKGDLYEYLLSKLTTAGINGQFRTPRHIIRTIVEMMEPNPARGESICDPACGTGGFLATSYEYLLENTARWSPFIPRLTPTNMVN